MPALIHMCQGIATSSVLFTLITSAPYSASTRPAVGPASTCVKSTTRTPSSGAGASPVASPSRIGPVNVAGSPDHAWARREWRATQHDGLSELRRRPEQGIDHVRDRVAVASTAVDSQPLVGRLAAPHTVRRCAR